MNAVFFFFGCLALLTISLKYVCPTSLSTIRIGFTPYMWAFLWPMFVLGIGATCANIFLTPHPTYPRSDGAHVEYLLLTQTEV